MKAKCTIIFVLFFFICNAQNDSSSKFTWSDTITNEIAPRIHKLIGSTEKKSYFVSLRGYDIITLDESNNVIDVKNYHRTHIIKRIIKFDDDNIYLVSAQKDKGVFNFYYSKFNLSEGTFGKTVLFDKIEEKTNRYDLFNDEDTPINDNYTGYVLSSDRQKVVFIHSVQNPKAKGDLKIRISYFNKNLERTKLNYIDLQRKKTLNKIVSFSLLNNENLIILINQFEPNVLVKFNENKSWVKPIVKIADYWRHIEMKPWLYKISKDGTFNFKNFDTKSLANQKIVSVDNNFFYTSRSKDEFKITYYDESFNEIYSKSFKCWEYRSNLKFQNLKNDICFTLENWTYETVIGRENNIYYRNVPEGFHFIIINKENGEMQINRKVYSAGPVRLVSIDNNLYFGYQYNEERYYNPRNVSRYKTMVNAILKIDSNFKQYISILPKKQFKKAVMKPNFYVAKNRLIFKSPSLSYMGYSSAYKVGSLRLTDILFEKTVLDYYNY